MGSLLDLLETVVFRIELDGGVVPLNKAAQHCLGAARGAGSPAVLQKLFGAPTREALHIYAQSNVRTVVTLDPGDGARKLRWEFMAPDGDEGPVLAAGINWMSVEDLVDRLTKETLIYKELVMNVVPRFVVDAMLDRKAVQPKAYREVTILFADAVGFAKRASGIDPVSLLKRLDHYFSLFDRVTGRYGVEKIKTIGDAYMAVSGIPYRKPSHAVDATLAALQLLSAVRRAAPPAVPAEGTSEASESEPWSFRIALHSGPCISGVLGAGKYMFDVWGGSVNTAAQLVGAGKADAVTVSDATHALVSAYFESEPCGPVQVPNSEQVIECHTVTRLRAEFAADPEGIVPNDAFRARYNRDFAQPGAVGSIAPPAPFLESIGKAGG